MELEWQHRKQEGPVAASYAMTWRNFPVKKFSFQILYQAFKTDPKNNKASRLQTLLLYLFGSLQTCYFSSLMLSDCTEQGFVSTVRNIVTFIRFDSIFVRYDLDSCFSIINYVIISLPYLSFCAEMIFKIMDLKVSINSLRYLIAWPVRYMQLAGFVPILVLMEAKVCYWLSNGTHMYDNVKLLSYETWDSLNCAIALIFILALFPLLLCGLFFDYNLYYNSKKRSFLARSRSYEYFTHLVGKIGMITMFVWTYDSNQYWVAVVFIGVGIVTGYLLYTRAPFYDTDCNIIFTWTSAALAWIGFSKFLGKLVDSEAVVALLILIIVPTLLLLFFTIMQVFSNTKVVTTISADAKFSQLEKQVRSELERLDINGEADFSSIQKLFSYRTTDLETMLRMSLFEAAFYAQECDDYEKAWISLIKFGWGSPTLESEFQKFKLQEFIRNVFQAGEMQYLEHLTRMDMVKVLDEQACWDLFNFCSELMSSSPKPEKCERLADRASHSINLVCKQYRAALISQPKNVQLHYLFGTFLSDVLSDASGKVYIQKADAISHSLSQRGVANDSFQAFDSAAILCISCTKERLGCIDLANDKALELLGYTRNELLQMTIGELLPRNLRLLHTELLTDIVLERKPMSALLEHYAVVMESKGFAIPLRPSAKVISQEEHSFIFLALTPNLHKEAVLVLDSDFMIMCNSETLGELTNFAGRINFTGFHIRDVFPISREELLNAGGVRLPLPNQEGVSYLMESWEVGTKPFYTFSLQRDLNRVGSFLDGELERRASLLKKGVRFTEADAMRLENRPKDSVAEIEKPETQITNTDSGLVVMTAETRKESHLPHIGSEVSMSSSIARVSIEETISQNVKKTARRFKLLIFIANVLVIAVVIATAIFMMNLIDQMERLDSLTNLSQRRHLAMDMTNEVRKLTLKPDFANETSIKTQLFADIAAFTDSMNLIKGMYGDWSNGPNKDIYVAPTTFISENFDGNLKFSLVGLFEAMYKLVDNVAAVANSPQSNNTDSSVYYILRNAPAETLASLNQSMFLYVNYESLIRDQNFQSIEGLIICSALVLALGLCVLVAPQVFFIEKYHVSTWKHIYAVNIAQLIETKHRVNDRLQSVHGNEISEADFRLRDIHSSRTPTRIWPFLGIKLSLILIVSAGFFVGLFLGTYPSLKLLLQTMPNYLNWGGLRSTATHGTNFWLREMYFSQHSQDSYFYELKDSSYWPSPEVAFENFTLTFSFIVSLLRTQDPLYGIYISQDTDAYKEYRYLDACFIGNNISNCEQTVTGLGLNYAILEYIQRTTDLEKQLLAGIATWNQINSVDQEKSDLFEATSNGLNFYQTESNNTIESTKVVVILATTLYCAILLALFFLYYMGVINKLQRRLCDRAAILKIVKSVNR